MCDVQNNIRFTWQLVSQFVSWDFCRYMCEQNETQISDVDVLTFLRNMIVQRTEKSITDITKHEIVAKFIMETIAVKDISRLPCIATLSESVKRICPELESAVDKLVRHLATFLSNLDSDEERQKEELIKLRIEEAVMDFSKEADRLLPSPNLLQVVESWNHHHGHVHQKQPKKVIYSAVLFEKVLECLNLEYNKITPSEAKIIAGSLYEDKVFERILAQAETETETEADSEQFSLSLQSSQPNDHIYSQEFAKNVQQEVADEIPINSELSNPDSLQLDDPPPYVQYLNASRKPCDPLPTVPSPSPPRSHQINRNILENRINPILQNCETDNGVQFDQSSARESDSDEPDCSLMTRFDTSSKSRLDAQKESTNQNRSDSDDLDHSLLTRFNTNNKSRVSTQKEFHNQSRSDSENLNCNLVTQFNTKSNRRVSAQKESTNQNSLYPDKLECSVMTQLNRSKNKLSSRKESNNQNLSDLDVFDCNMMTESNTTTDSRINAQRHSVNQDESDADTSDCEKNPEFRFLTPTLFKEGGNNNATAKSQKFIYLSDTESNDSSVRTISGIGSQRNDPTWLSHKSARAPLIPVKKNPKRFHKKKVIVISDSEDSDARVTVHEENDQGEITYANPVEKPTKRRRLEKTVRLYRSPNISIDDFCQIRRHTPVVSNDIPVHRGTNTKPVAKKTLQSVKNSNKRQKCKQCNKAFKTVIALRRHIFLQHTAPISSTPDSDVS